jgi:hypothetical protein
MKKGIRDAGLIQFGPGMTPEKVVSYDAFNAGDDPQPVVCLRCADGPAVSPSVRDVCTRCFAAVWVSRITEAAMTHLRQPVLVCMSCVAQELPDEPPDA